jgi:hypothetical protein
MWQRAEAGLAPDGVVLSEPGGNEDQEATQRLLRLQGQAAKRRADPYKSKTRLVKGSTAAAPSRPVVVGALKDISALEPNSGALINPGVAKPGVIFPAPAKISRPEPRTTGSGGAANNTATSGPDEKGRAGATTTPPKARSVLPPADDREQLAYDAVQAALALNDPEIADLRARRGVGADAMDDLRQLFEIKMASGPMPNEITLTQAEAAAAQDPDFFLAVVEGLEETSIPLSVRFIFDPLRTLAQRITGNVTLSGIREVEALQYVFGKPDES